MVSLTPRDLCPCRGGEAEEIERSRLQLEQDHLEVERLNMEHGKSQLGWKSERKGERGREQQIRVVDGR